jgi:hypothetical protein
VRARLPGEPEVFFTTPACDGWPLVMVLLAQVDVEQPAELVTGAWRTRARPAQASEVGKTGGRPDTQPGSARHRTCSRVAVGGRSVRPVQGAAHTYASGRRSGMSHRRPVA